MVRTYLDTDFRYYVLGAVDISETLCLTCLDHLPLTGPKEWAMGWDNALIFGALKIPIAHHCDATMWADLATLNFCIACNFHAIMWAFDHSGIWAIDSHNS